MTIFLSLACCVLVIVTAALWGDHKHLQNSLARVRADRDQAWERVNRLHREHARELVSSAARLDDLTARLRTATKED